MREVSGETLIQVAGFRPTRAAFEALLREQTGMEPPPPGEAVSEGAVTLMRTGPEQFWIINGSVTLPPDIGAVTQLSSSRTRFVLEGQQARATLAKGIPLDLDPDVFPVGRFAMTGLHHTPVLLWRRGADAYELWALRTYAAAVREWLEDAGRES